MFSLSTSFSHRIVVSQLEFNGEMKNYFKNQYLQLLRNQGNKAGIVPVENTENEVERLAEVKRLGIMELDLSGERRYNSMTQVATYLTGCKQSAINILGSNVQ